MEHQPASTSPLRSKFKNEPSKTVTKQSKSVDDSLTMQTKIPKRSQLPTVQFKTAQTRPPEYVRPDSGIPQGPKRSRSSPSSSLSSYAHAISSKQAALQPNAPKSSDTSPNLLHRQTAIPVPLAHSFVASSVPKKPSTLHPSVSVPGTAKQLESQRQRLVDRAAKARLYLLRQTGPNRFLIGGDSPDSRFHVTIGPQSCSCNRSHCVHLLFVMLRVLKVNRNDPMLWMRQLRNYEAESLLQEFQARLNQRTTPKKPSKKKFNVTQRNPRAEDKPSTEKEHGQQNFTETQSLPPSVIGGSVTVTKSDSCEGSDGSGEVMTTVMEEEEGEGEESDKSDNEEAVCPICLNELDEGEDLLVCSSCHNHLHQHCMDIWAGELRRKKEDVRCPVCRAHWPYTAPLAPNSPSTQMTAIHITVPVGGNDASPTAVGGAGNKSSSPSHFVLSGQKMQLLEKMKSIFGSAVEGLFSSDWKAREAAVMHITREAIPLLLPHVQPPQSRVPTMNEGATGSGGNNGDAREIQEVCMQVVTIAANDSVLKVFLAALELMRVVLGYSICNTEEEATYLQSLLAPILPVILTRCADAQRRVKNCSIETACNLCLGQDGPLGVGSACGSQSSKIVSDVRFILQSTLSNQFDANHSWHWWLGRLAFIDRMLSHFSWDFLLPQCQLNPQNQHTVASSDYDSDDKTSSNSESVSGQTSPIDSICSSIVSALVVEGTGSNSQPQSFEFEQTAGMEPGLADVGTELRQIEEEASEASSPSPLPTAVDSNLLMQVWYFAAKATHIPHRKLGKLAQKVIIKIAKGLQDDPVSLEIVHDVVSKCHRTQAEGLLDKVLNAREKPLNSITSDDRRGTAAAPAETVAGVRPRGREAGRSSPHSSHGREKRRASSSSPDRGRSDRQEEATAKFKANKHRVSADLSYFNVETSYKHLGATGASSKKLSFSPDTRGMRKTDTDTTLRADSPEFEGSDESFQSAISDLEHRHMIREDEEEGSEETSSASNSHDSKAGRDPLSRSSSGYASVGSGASAAGGIEMRPGAGGLMSSSLYKRQSTVESAISTDEDYSTFGYMCKRNIEEEEAAAEAKVRSMLPQDAPHPSLSGMPLPSSEHKVLIHIQRSKLDGGKEGTDGVDSPPYLEGEHWVKGKLIGTGAFCSCFLARDIRNGTMFAVKQVSYVRNTQKEQEDELNRLKQEVAMLGRLNHPNVVRCLGATQHDGHINVFVEWMAGGCLDQLLHDFGRFSESVACDYTRQITYGIVYLHENGIIHRDLKGGNILVDSTGRRLRIADFGAAARLATNTTGAGEFQEMEGTVAFMAPEVVRGGQVDETGANIGYGRKCDVWSIGCVIIQMITAKPPWSGTYEKKNKFQLIFTIGQATEPPPMPEFSNPSLKDFTIRCLEIRPEDRPTSSELLKHPLFTASA